MPPTLLQLQSTGIQDSFLTQNPQINVFKYSYYQYVNFATEYTKLQLSNNASFGERTFCIIPKRGHLLSKLYLHLKLPPLVKKDGDYASWVNALGYAIFKDPIELEIGGVVVDRIYPQFSDIWDDLSNNSKHYGKNLMTLKSDVWTSTKTNAEREVDLMIPLEFWFTKERSMALPVLSMPHQEIRVNFRLRTFEECINFDGTQPDNVDIIDSNIFAEYVYLDDVIIPTFANQKHMYVIDQVQYDGIEYIAPGVGVHQSSLKFNNCVKEIVFALNQKTSLETNNYFNYSNTITNGPLLSEAAFLIDGHQRIEFLPESFFRLAAPYGVHSVVPIKYIYCLPFSLRPEDSQPTGSINLSRFSNVSLSLRLQKNHPACYLHTFAVSHNVVTIENGFLNFEFVV